MALISLPAGAEFDRNVWLPQRTIQVNRSAYTRTRQALHLGGDGWIVSATITPVSTPAEFWAWQAFVGKLQNELNTFFMPAAYDQHEGNERNVGESAAGTRFITLSGTVPVLPGMYITVPLVGDAYQLATIIDVSGTTLTLDRTLRKATASGSLARTRDPVGHVALTSPPAPDDSDGTFSWSFEAEEVIR